MKNIFIYFFKLIDLGFNAIWISPVPDNYPNAFHGYAAKNMTEINSHFGGESGLRSLIDACHKRGKFSNHTDYLYLLR